MERLTSSQINDFNNPLAFARERTARVGEVDLTARSSSTLRTNDREASFRLVRGATQRLETMRSNLLSMLKLSRAGERSSNSPLRTEEIYGKLRSLSAGFDQVVNSVRFDGKPIFNGNRLTLGMDSGSRPLSMDTSKLLTHGENSLNLSTTKQTAEITVFEAVDDVILNQNATFTGVSLTGATYIEGSNPALELDNTSYKIKILFTGNNSAIEIRDRFGILVERQDGIDLTGRGREFVDFNVGIRLEIEKKPAVGALDSLDFTFDKAVEVNASILYRRIETHTLRNTGDQENNIPDGATLLFDARLGNTASGQLSVANPQLTPPTNITAALESGFYNLSIEYRGKNSFVRLTDALGRVRGFLFDLDLTNERTIVNFDGGLSVVINNTGLSDTGRLEVPIRYNRRPPAIQEFDFRKYSGQIKDAIEAVESELRKMQETQTRIEEIQAQRNPNTRANAQTAASLAASSSLNILSGGNSGPLSVLKQNPSEQLAIAANAIFSSTSALRTQANQTPEQLRSLQQAAASNILSGANPMF
jgi:sporulation-control protein spo0M